MSTTLEALERRITALEDREAIRELKADYLNGCDAKDVERVRACFAPGEVLIDYGWIGVFTDRDSFVKVFRDMGCHPHMLDMHHGSNPQIEITGDNEARGQWALHYQNINADTHALTQLAVAYSDTYTRTPDGWKIHTTRVRYLSTLAVDLDTGQVQRIDKAPG